MGKPLRSTHHPFPSAETLHDAPARDVSAAPDLTRSAANDDHQRDASARAASTAPSSSRFDRAATTTTQLCGITRQLVLSTALVLALALLITNRVAVANAAADLASRVKGVEFAGVKMAFQEVTIAETFRLSGALSPQKANDPVLARKIAAKIASLTSAQYARLMNVGHLKGLCAYPDGNKDLRHYAALDERLERDGLVVSKDDPLTQQAVRGYFQRALAEARHTARGDDSAALDNGVPERCYTMELTETGFDVKTALVQTFGQYVERLGDSSRDDKQPATVSFASSS